MRRGVSAAAVAVAVLVGAPAASASSFVIGNGADPHVAVDDQGIGHVVWNESRAVADGGDMLQYCQVPRGATGCQHPQTLVPPLGRTDHGGPRVLLGATPMDVVLLSYRCCGDASGPNSYPTHDFSALWAWVSSDGGLSFGSPRLIGNNEMAAGDAIFGPGASQVSTIDGVNLGASFQAASLDASARVETKAAVGDRGSAVLGCSAGATLALVNPTTPIAACSDTANTYYRVWGGMGSYDDLTTWQPIALLGPEVQPHLASGPRGVYLMTQTSGGAFNVRHYGASGFGAPVTIPAASSVSASPFSDLSQDSGGTLHAVSSAAAARSKRLSRSTALPSPRPRRWSRAPETSPTPT